MDTLRAKMERTRVPKGMRIAVFGASLVSGYENGAATYCRGVLRALARRGHAIRFYEPAMPERLAHRDILDPSWARVIRFESDGAGVEAGLEQASDTDVLVKCSGIGVFDELLEAAVPHCAVPPAISVYWDLNPAATLRRLETESGQALRAQLPWYDLVLTRYGGDRLIEIFQRAGARVCFPIYSALDPDVHYPVPPDPGYAAAMVFLGHRVYEREAQVQRSLLDVAATLRLRRFILAGCGWEDVGLPSNVHYVGYVYTAEHNLFNASATAVLNLTRPSIARWGHAPTARLFEAAGAGACVISDPWAGIDAFFEPDREILIAHDGMEVIEHVSNTGAERAAAIGRRALARSRREHTYDRRAAELEALLEGFDRQRVNETAL